MTVWRPKPSPYFELHQNLYLDSSGQKTVHTGFAEVKAADPHITNKSSYEIAEINGLSVNHSGGDVDVFVNCSGNDDSGSGVLANESLGGVLIDLEVYGI